MKYRKKPVVIDGRAWVGLRCLNGRHETCRHRARCECRCHAMVTGGLRLHMEPA